MLPNDIDRNQEVSLLSFAQEIPDFSTSIFYDLKMVDGLVEEKSLYSIKQQSLENLLKSYLKQKNVANKERRL